MAPKRNAKAAASSTSRTSAGRKTASRTLAELPHPFQEAPDSLRPFFDELSPRHVYIVHVDGRPRDFKRKIFAVPVLMNVAVALLFVWRVWYIGPYYWLLLETALGSANEATLRAVDLEWRKMAEVVLRRGFSFMLDLCLAIFVWPWPVEFVAGNRHGSPVQWRWAVGFRDKEIYVRRSRSWYAEARTGGIDSMTTKKVDLLTDEQGQRLLLGYVVQATAPSLLEQKTGYLTMDGSWDLDWAMMVWATTLVDKKDVGLEAFGKLVLLHHDVYGWVTVDKQVLGGVGGAGSASAGDEAANDERRLQVLAFREALSAMDKEDLFFRWIEIIQREVAKPGGLGDEQRQAVVAAEVRALFSRNGVDFDELWRDSVGSDGLAGILDGTITRELLLFLAFCLGRLAQGSLALLGLGPVSPGRLGRISSLLLGLYNLSACHVSFFFPLSSFLSSVRLVAYLLPSRLKLTLLPDERQPSQVRLGLVRLALLVQASVALFGLQRLHGLTLLAAGRAGSRAAAAAEAELLDGIGRRIGRIGRRMWISRAGLCLVAAGLAVVRSSSDPLSFFCAPSAHMLISLPSASRGRRSREKCLPPVRLSEMPEATNKGTSPYLHE
ncbi:hypothetical protein CMQ_1147 [Grosmannia clavigera kw1407]|uniref:Uncharacterized protein n=1 Tax=Grosmannia clavigera (strain kw1407 / UAMH 11150) TaxID=655863 RepID=F0XEH5_GROCL|nr:uncharacterized protein CMQ_1147 [Grosmannia clavigera kw1407]EFX04219.1 hypothetical protein CMQ_1147 [Grosmannia clavigera kw1407]